MSNEVRSTSTGTVIGFGFIILGIFNLFASGIYHRTSINTTGRIPGILFIAVGMIILIIKMIKKTRE